MGLGPQRFQWCLCYIHFGASHSETASSDGHISGRMAFGLRDTEAICFLAQDQRPRESFQGGPRP